MKAYRVAGHHQGKQAKAAEGCRTPKRWRAILSPLCQAKERGFSRVDLLVVIAVVAVLALVKLSALAGSKGPGQSAVCQNNLRQLGVAVLMYSAENADRLPPRSKYPWWTIRLQRYYSNTNFLVCPSDSWRGYPTAPAPDYPHSYVLNAWNDYFFKVLEPAVFESVYLNGVNSIWGMPESAIPAPSLAITFGEKVSQWVHHYADLFQADILGNDANMVERARHFRSAQDETSGGSNYAFADGSARFLKRNADLSPTNLWVVIPEFQNYVYVGGGGN